MKTYNCTVQTSTIVLHKTGPLKPTRQSLFAELQKLGIKGACSFTAYRQTAYGNG